MSEKKLEQTNGSFKLKGQVVGLENDFSYGEGQSDSGRDWRRLRFGVKTSPTNVIYVELLGSTLDEIKIKAKDKDSIKHPFDERDNLPDGYYITNFYATRCALERDGNKLVNKNLVKYDAIKYIKENLKDGDSVFASGNIEFSVYNDKPQVKYVLGYISKQSKEVDFDDENFKEISDFEQEVVVMNTDVDKENKKVYVNGYVIDFKENFENANFVINAETHEKLAKNFIKKVKEGDLIKVKGKCINAAETVEVEEPVDDDWGSEETAFDNNVITNYVNELRIVGVDPNSHVKKKYKADDFVKDEFDEAEEEDFDEFDDEEDIFGDDE